MGDNGLDSSFNLVYKHNSYIYIFNIFKTMAKIILYKSFGLCLYEIRANQIRDD